MATKKPLKKPAKKPLKKPAKKPLKKPARSPELQKVAFTLFPIVDAKRARAFYEGTLGLTRGLASPEGTWTEYDLPGGGCLALFCHPDPGSRQKPGGYIAFEVADLDALNRRLKKAGVTYQGEMVHGPHCRMSNILDSEGNAIILHQLNPS
jgi:predicted enzyme related to lactoylglutathione lyase